MPYRKIKFVNGDIYHVTNRGVNHDLIFTGDKDRHRFLDSTNFSRFISPVQYSYFNRLTPKAKEKLFAKLEEDNAKLVEILVFALMPNHYHYLLRQLVDNGIQNFMRNFQNSYAKYFNIKHKRIGPLFQSAFKVTCIENDEQLLHTSRYIHLNPVSSSIIKIKDLAGYSWTSLPEYLGEDRYSFINTKAILEYFDGDSARYKKFIESNADNQKERQIIKENTY